MFLSLNYIFLPVTILLASMITLSSPFSIACLEKNKQHKHELEGNIFHDVFDNIFGKKNKTMNSASYRAQVFKETIFASLNGYTNEAGTYITIPNAPMLQNTETYDKITCLPPISHHYKTQFNVIAEDTFQVMLARRAEGGYPVGINMANRFYIGGGVEGGSLAQEEALCRSSNYFLSLKTQAYPFPEFGGIYSNHVQIFRQSEAHDFTFMPKPEEVALVAVAAYNLGSSYELKHLGLPLEGRLTEEILSNNEHYMRGSKSIIRNMLRMMATKGHTQLVLGALGCGAFGNPPKLIARLFEECFMEEEFIGRFERVDFAILCLNSNDQKNVDAFSVICENLNSQ